MSKGDKTRELILDNAFRLFALKGYATVTMKDICESSGLSRGGLYRHFPSTKEIFTAILSRDLEVNSAAVDEAIKSGAPAGIIFGHYLEQEKAAVFSERRGFYFAVHEFAFLEQDQRGYFDFRVKRSAGILSKIFSYGQKRGEFRQFDANAMAVHTIYFWDSLKTSSSVLTLTGEDVEKQINLIKEMIQ
ncbi:MAG: TetR/AcrR family transcriptional regulator [Syntrophaceae bacterium]|nr:TetR/AcrR family transcriptional regulator [Syntrophaceae bacterium]